MKIVHSYGTTDITQQLRQDSHAPEPSQCRPPHATPDLAQYYLATLSLDHAVAES
ncbi:hypothetical protein [Picosynechococcus sp. PCC 7003]|uniref:hypothetical protein n=1 Tax=Picosynechococcus sp. PCC 7003 TaxID=374981 RepID=UPI000B054FF5|nr:hypothetical protein [Picosynechococcus sp. PCC 7003]